MKALVDWHRSPAADISLLADALGMDQRLPPPLPAKLSQDAFPFLKLPPEIRNMIYLELVSAGFLGWQSAVRRLSRRQYTFMSRPEDWEPEGHSTPSILLVNRKIYQEAIHILYSIVFELKVPISAIAISSFFCKSFFQQLRYVTLTMDAE